VESFNHSKKGSNKSHGIVIALVTWSTSYRNTFGAGGSKKKRPKGAVCQKKTTFASRHSLE